MKTELFLLKSLDFYRWMIKNYVTSVEAEKAGHYWFDLLDTEKIELGSSKHKLVDNGFAFQNIR